MSNVYFMKDVIAESAKKISFILINQKQLKDVLTFTLNTYLSQQKTIIVVALSTNSKEIISVIPEQLRKKVFVIDCFTQQAASEENVFTAQNPSDLTSIQVALDTIEKTTPGEKVIIFDSMSVLSIYNDKNTFGRFLHLFTNKMLLREDTTLMFTSKNSTDEETLSIIQSFSNKTYDYSGAVIEGL